MTQPARVTLPATAHEPAVAVPAIGQGTWYMGEGPASRADEIRALQLGMDLGMTLIDTAEMYADGGAEKVVGQALAGRRDEAFLVSKVYPWNAGRDSAIAACEATLERLGTDHLDLYLLHWPGGIPLDETLEAFERLREDGKIRRFGVSNFDVDDMEGLYGRPGGDSCAINQVLYHLGSRGIEHALRPWHRQHGMPLMGYCPLARAGRLQQDPLTNEVVNTLAAEQGLTPAQLMLAWAVRPIDGLRDLIATPKAVHPDHVRDNAAVLQATLDDQAIDRLEAEFPAPFAKEALDVV